MVLPFTLPNTWQASAVRTGHWLFKEVPKAEVRRRGYECLKCHPFASGQPLALWHGNAGLPELKNPFSPPQKGHSSNNSSPFSWCLAPVPQPSRYLHAVVVCAFPIQVAAMIVHATVIQGAEAHEAVLEGIIAFLVHVVMPNHILFTSESLERYRDRQWDTRDRGGWVILGAGCFVDCC